MGGGLRERQIDQVQGLPVGVCIYSLMNRRKNIYTHTHLPTYIHMCMSMSMYRFYDCLDRRFGEKRTPEAE